MVHAAAVEAMARESLLHVQGLRPHRAPSVHPRTPREKLNWLAVLDQDAGPPRTPGKRGGWLSRECHRPVHPRTPGEMTDTGLHAQITVGPPPYAGGKAHDRPACRGLGRSTPVRREKRRASPCRVYGIPVHPRTPGENRSLSCCCFCSPGPPPYAGGKGSDDHSTVSCHGSTPARRGKGETGVRQMKLRLVHPRTPGERGRAPSFGLPWPGPPPHAGGKGILDLVAGNSLRSTPVRRGKR